MVIGFTTLPLRLIVMLGLLMSVFGSFVFLYAIWRYFKGTIPGFPFILSIISIFSGAQMFSIGMLGEYLARIYGRTMGKPAYIIKTQINGRGKEEN
jgi:undecaprenyl-phosphate 4-deoxy-4-formamido-L-arabinose transferase